MNLAVRLYKTMNYKLVAYIDVESLVLANVFGSLRLDLVHNLKLLSVWRNITGHCWSKGL